jgi:hypothetical protein
MRWRMSRVEQAFWGHFLSNISMSMDTSNDVPIAGPGRALESTKGWSEVSGAVWTAEARQNVSKGKGGVFPIWNRMPVSH